MKQKKGAKFWICIALVLCLVSMIGSNLLQSNFGKIQIVDYDMTLAEMAEVIRANNAATGRDIKIDFTEDSTANFHFRLFLPKNVSADAPVPGIVTAHGGDNTLEVQMPFNVELARRGFVVLTMDMAGHGESDNAILGLTSDSYGMLAAAEYLMSMPEVDNTQIGLTGHSMGNLCSMNTLMVLNAAESTQRIRAWVLGDGTLYSFSMIPDYAEGLIMTMNVGRHSEMDVIYVGAIDYLGTPLAAGNVKVFWPEFSDARVAAGQWYGGSGPIDSPDPGQKLDVDKAFRLYNNENTHPGWHFSTTCTGMAINGFYSAFGVPGDAKYIPENRQIWPLVEVFGFIGLVGFFMLLLQLVVILANSKLFSAVKNPLPDKESLPAFKNPKEWIIALVTIAILAFVCFKSYLVLYPAGNRIFDTTRYSVSVQNSLGLWTAFCGFVVLVMICLNYFAKRLAYGKDAKLANPFAAARTSWSQFFLTLLLTAVAVILAFIPVIFAEEVFKADFRVCTVAVQSGNLDKLYAIIKYYLPMWLLFYIPNALFNANTRYRDLPEWVSTAICVLANGLALIIMIVIQYGTIFGKGYVPYPDMTMGGIVACISLAFLMFAGVSARYIYKKTGNVWLAGMINGTIACLMSLYSSWFSVDFVIY